MGNYGRTIAAEKNMFNHAVVNLVGIIEGILCDGNLNNDEIKYLDTWLKHNSEISNLWPGNAVYARVRDVLADGIITDDERNSLVKLLNDIIGDTSEDDAGSAVTNLGFDEYVQVKFADRIFCFTGEFAYGTRPACEEATLKRGGAIHGSVVKSLDYLVVGGLGSPEWKNGSYGTKIEKAMEYKARGAVIHVVHESQWVSSLRG
jgi:NAD-dependent DNA ligase